MDAVELLKHDHRMVDQLFRDYRPTGGRLAGHRPIKDLLLQLDHLSPGADGEAALIDQLEAEVREHVEADESRLMPRHARPPMIGRSPSWARRSTRRRRPRRPDRIPLRPTSRPCWRWRRRSWRSMTDFGTAYREGRRHECARRD